MRWNARVAGASVDNVIQFPQKARIALLALFDDPVQHGAITLIEHGRETYELSALMQHLAPRYLREVSTVNPQSWQELWDEITQSWPIMADELAAACMPVSSCMTVAG